MCGSGLAFWWCCVRCVCCVCVWQLFLSATIPLTAFGNLQKGDCSAVGATANTCNNQQHTTNTNTNSTNSTNNTNKPRPELLRYRGILRCIAFWRCPVGKAPPKIIRNLLKTRDSSVRPLASRGRAAGWERVSASPAWSARWHPGGGGAKQTAAAVTTGWCAGLQAVCLGGEGQGQRQREREKCEAHYYPRVGHLGASSPPACR